MTITVAGFAVITMDNDGNIYSRIPSEIGINAFLGTASDFAGRILSVRCKIELFLIAFVVAILSACSNPVQSSNPITVSLPSSETIWQESSESLIQWTGGNTDSVFIQLLKGGSCVDTLAITTPNSGEFSLSNGLQWGYGEDYQIRVNDFSTESGTSNEFSIWAIVVTEPNFSTVWEWEQTNTEVEWLPCPGSTVRMEIWKDGYKVDDYCDWTDDDGSYTRSSAIPGAWGEGDDYQIKMIDDLNNVGWSEEYTILDVPQGSYYNPSTGHYYLLNDSSLAWNEARDWAESYSNGYLVTINNQSEMNWLSTTFGPSGFCVHEILYP